MGKINDTTNYANVAPADADHVIGTDVSNTANSPNGETVTFTFSSILTYVLAGLDGDHLDVDFTPTNYTPDATPAEAADVDDLAAHLQGIDTALGTAGGGLVFLASTDIASSASTVEFTAFDSTKYDAYLFVLQNVFTTSDEDNLAIRVSTDNGSTWKTGPYEAATLQSDVNAESARAGFRDDLTAIYIAGDANTSLSDSVGNSSVDAGVSGNLWVMGTHLAQYTWLKWHTVWGDQASRPQVEIGGGFYETTTEVDGLQFLWNLGNFASGTITMYGLVNS